FLMIQYKPTRTQYKHFMMLEAGIYSWMIHHGLTLFHPIEHKLLSKRQGWTNKLKSTYVHVVSMKLSRINQLTRSYLCIIIETTCAQRILLVEVMMKFPMVFLQN